MPRLFSYVVARDYGFAPNPFHGVCTLATCKPKVRQHAVVGDWIAGITASRDKRTPSLVYVMQVNETLSFEEYWASSEFQCKKPSRSGSVKQALGDNIYSRASEASPWRQIDSHHSLADGTPNPQNIANDTQTNRILIGRRFAYWGSKAPLIPQEFLGTNDQPTLKVARAHKNQFPPEFVNAFINWFEERDEQGYLGKPFKWIKPKADWARSKN
jgi:hypothetical protein